MKICAKCNTSFEEGIAYCPTDGARLTTVSKMQEAGKHVPAAAIEQARQIAEEEGIEDLTGRTVAGRYSITRKLGEGGMGIVYRATDTRLEKDVAIKVLKEDFARRTDVVARFTQEAKSAARIKHENVLDVTDYGQTEAGSFYIAMELLTGTDLADLLQKVGGIDAVRCANITIQVTRALGAAHGKGIVHRDLKPENVFLVQGEDDREVVKIVDFGIAQMKDLSGGEGGTGADTSRKLTRTGMIFGTPEYMSPEQAAGKNIDHRVDIYATGVIMYEMLAGRVPFVGDTFMGVLTQHMFENPPPILQLRPQAVVPPDFEAVIYKALAKDPAHRYQSMQELTDDLVRFREGARPGAVNAVIPGAPARPNFSHQSGGVTPDTLTGQTPSIRSESATLMNAAPRSKRTLGIVAGVAVLLVAIGGIAVARSSSSGTNTNTTANVGGGAATPIVTPELPHPIIAPPVVAVPGANGSGSAAGTGTPVNVAPEPTEFHVHVATEPVSARVEVEGMADKVCAATPCDLVLPRGREVRLLATAPRKHAEQTFTAAREGETITLQLTATAHTGGGGGARASGGGGGGRPRTSGCRPGQSMRVDPSTGLMVPCFLGH